jgi:HAD superfamily hydrolase (TIGR01549 family)
MHRESSGRNIEAIAFDAFGTVVRVHDKNRPYNELARLSGRRDARERLMSAPLDLQQAATTLGLAVSDYDGVRMQRELDMALASIAVFDDVLPALAAVRESGYRIAIVSNLAQPYGGPLKRLLNGVVDTWVLSYEVGHIKPDPQIYRYAAAQLAVPPARILMVGDTVKDDYDGARAAGFDALVLDRFGRFDLDKAFARITSLIDLLPWLSWS